ncbi:MAG: O-antigen ligase family protein [Candidatus Muiribacteriota bacterium]
MTLKNNLNQTFIFAFVLFYLIFISFVIVNFDYEIVFFILIFTAGTFLLLYEPLYALIGVFFCANIFNPSLRLGFINIYASNALLIASFIFLILNRITGRGKNFFHTNAELPVFLFFIIALSTIRPDTITEQTKRILAYGVFFLSYIVSVNMLKDKKTLIKFLEIIFHISFIGSVYVLYTFIFSPFLGAALRGYGAFINPNAYGVYMLCFLPLFIYFAFKKNIIIYKFQSLIMVFGFVSTISRSAIFSLAVSFVFINVFFKRNYWYFLFSFLLFLTIIFYPPVFERVQDIATFTDQSLLARITLWKDAINQFKTSPLAGIGAGNFIGSALPYDSRPFNGAFNQFFTILAEMGVIGFFVYLWFTVIVIFYMIKGYFAIKSRFYANLILAILCSTIAFQSLSFAEDPLMAIMANWAYGIIIGIFYAIWRFELYESDDNISHIRS